MALLDQLYTQSPGTVPTAAAPAATPVQAPQAAQATASTTGPAAQANSTGFSAATGSVPTGELASSQLNDITSQDSPLMKRARQEGILAAAKRGLQNSSIAGGNSQAAMVDRATPLALANAAALNEQRLANQSATNRASEVSTGRQTDVSLANANASNEMARLNAQLETATSQGNAQEVNAIRTRMAELETQTRMQGADIAARANELSSAQENQMRMAVMEQNAQLNRQFLQGEQANSLESIRMRYESLISGNRAASDLYNAYFQSISAAMSNPNIKPDRAAQIVSAQQTALNAGLTFIGAMNATGLPAEPAPLATPVAPPPAVGTTSGNHAYTDTRNAAAN